MTTVSPTPRIWLLGAALWLSAAGCTTAEPERPTYAVSLRLGGALPDKNRVGDYTVTLTEGRVVLGDWWIYGMDRADAGYAAGLKHAGHLHGEAEFETNVQGTFAVDLLAEPQVLATPLLTEGHYFDGSLRLRPASALYTPVYATDGNAVTTQEALWGHALLLAGSAQRDDEPVVTFRITVDAEALIAGLEYGATVWAEGARIITTRLDLGALLAEVDFAAVADGSQQLTVDCETNPELYALIKARLQDPALYRHSEAEDTPQ